MVNGKPGNGSTPIEVLLGGVMSTWYLGSAAGVIWAHYAGEAIARQAAIVVCFLVHTRVASKVLMATEKGRQAFVNSQKITKGRELMLHGSVSIASLIIFMNA